MYDRSIEVCKCFWILLGSYFSSAVSLRLETFEIELAALSDCHKPTGDGMVCFNLDMKLSPQSLVVRHRYLVCGLIPYWIAITEIQKPPGNM